MIRTADQLFEALWADLILRHCAGKRVLDLGEDSPDLLEWASERSGELLTVSAQAVQAPRPGPLRLPVPSDSVETAYSTMTVSRLLAEAPAVAAQLLAEVGRVLTLDGTLIVVLGSHEPVRMLGTRRARRRLLGQFLASLPDSLTMTELRGIGAFVRTGRLLRRPWLARALLALEWWARDRPLLTIRAVRAVLILHRVPTSTIG